MLEDDVNAFYLEDGAYICTSEWRLCQVPDCGVILYRPVRILLVMVLGRKRPLACLIGHLGSGGDVSPMFH